MNSHYTFPIPPHTPELKYFEQGINECHDIINVASHQNSVKPIVFSNNQPNHEGILRGYWTQYPTYCLITWPLPDNHCYDSLLTIKRILVRAHLIMLQIMAQVPTKRYHSRLQESFRVFRILATEVSREDAFPLPSPKGCDVKQYLTRLNASSDGMDATLRILHDGLRRAFEAATYGTGGWGRTVNTQAHKPQQRVTLGHVKGSSAPAGVLVGGPVSDAEIVAATKLRSSPEELVTGRLHFRMDGFISTTCGQTPASAFAARQYQVKQLQRASQMLPVQWDSLSLANIESLHLALAETAELVVKDAADSTITAKELIAFIALQFWLSHTAEELLETRCVADSKNLPNTIIHNYIAADTLSVHLPSYRPPGARRISIIWRDCAETVSESLTVRLPLAARRLIKPYLQDAKKLNGMAMFSHPSEMYVNLVKNVLKRINKARGSRLTEGRLGTHLGIALANHCGDPVVASLALGKLVGCLHHSGTYYTRSPVFDLARVYSSYAEPLSVLLEGRPTGKTRVKHIGHVGSCVVPKTKFLQGFVEKLIHNISRYHHDTLIQVDCTVDFHNNLTAYCLAMLASLTGYRPVRPLLDDFSALDPVTGCVVIADKRTNISHECRLTWLPPVAVQQLLEYRQWRDRIARLHHLSDAPFFFLHEDRCLKLVTSSSLEEVFGQQWRLPLNALRHFYRSYLTDLGVPGEVIDAVMGHATFGREPHSIFSGLSPAHLYQELEVPLTKLAQMLGWKVIQC